ncbi:MAG: hypothetical protein PHU07_11550, partial [Acidocella sp.]|nr:hypothetical protein [Acidocella sp.]
RLPEAGLKIGSFKTLPAIAPDHATLACVFTGREETLAVDAVVLVTARLPTGTLHADLLALEGGFADAGIEQVTAIGDALAPATIAHAVYAGRRYAEELDEPAPAEDVMPFRREIAELLD